MPSTAGGVLPGAHLRTTFTGLSVGTPLQAPKPGVVKWAPQLVTKSDVQVQRTMPDDPEHLAVQLVSHVGRRGLGRNNEGQRDANKKAEPPAAAAKGILDGIGPEAQEYLIYMALYRAKVDQHQAALERGIEPRGRALLDSSPSPSSGRRAVAEAAAPEDSVACSSPAHSHDQLNGGASTSRSFRTREAGRAVVANAGQQRHHSPGAEGPAHIASVSSKAGRSGGMLEDFDETKRLGQLFDEYFEKRAAQEEEDGKNQRPRVHQRPPRRDIAEAICISPPKSQVRSSASQESSAPLDSALASGDLQLPQPTAIGSARSHPLALTVQTQAALGTKHSVFDLDKMDDIVIPARQAVPVGQAHANRASSELLRPPVRAHGSQSQPEKQQVAAVAKEATSPGHANGEVHHPHNSPRCLDRRLAERVYWCITDPRVRRKHTTERGLLAEMSGKKEPMTIEGFPTIHLTRLYRGRAAEREAKEKER